MNILNKFVLCISLFIPFQVFGHTLTVKSTGASNVIINSSTGFGGVTDYERETKIGINQIAVLVAPPISSGRQFAGWTGCDSTSEFTCTVTISEDRTVTVSYGAPDNYTLTVRSSGVFGVPITSSNGYSGQTDYNKSIPSGEVVHLGAPSTAGGKQFDGWSGCSSTSDVECNVTMSSDRTVTAAYSLLSATSPDVVTNAAIDITSESANVHATINPNGSSTNGWFEFGTTTQFGSSTPQSIIGSGTSSVSYSAGLNGLICNSTYYFRIVAQNEIGTSFGGTESFRTLDCPPSPPVPGDRIVSGHTGIWYNPATDGQGFFITAYPDLNLMFASWYTYDTFRPADGTPYDLGEPGHRWITAQGPYSENEGLLDIYVTRGGIFDNPQAVNSVRDGTLNFQFDNCLQGTATYDIPSIGRQGVIPIYALLTDVDRCEAQVAGEYQPETRKSGADSKFETQFKINTAISDSWYNPATPGQGFFITVSPTQDFIVVSWFTFDTFRPPVETPHDLGDPGHRWLFAQGEFNDDEAFLQVYFGQNGIFDGGDPADLYVLEYEGTAYIKFANCESGTLTYDLPSIGVTGEIPIQRIANDNIAECELMFSETE